MARYYSGKYQVVNPGKYEGDSTNVIYRSSWEAQVFKWLDLNPNVESWGSEVIAIPYICKTDGKQHRYFVDLKVRFKSGKVVLVEIKPKAQTKPPEKRRKTKKYIEEVMTYAKNVSKWQSATQYAKHHDWDFQIWTEETLTNSLGINMGGKS